MGLGTVDMLMQDAILDRVFTGGVVQSVVLTPSG